MPEIILDYLNLGEARVEEIRTLLREQTRMAAKDIRDTVWNVVSAYRKYLPEYLLVDKSTFGLYTTDTYTIEFVVASCEFRCTPNDDRYNLGANSSYIINDDISCWLRYGSKIMECIKKHLEELNQAESTKE